MAAPTNVRVEAESQTTVRLRWTYSGSLLVVVYQSVDGSSYSTVPIQPALNATEFEVTGLSTGTKYWFKLSDDGGSTFSSVVTVLTHACPVDGSDLSESALPRANDTVTADEFNELALKIEGSLSKVTKPDEGSCVACIEDNALVFDCFEYDGCNRVTVNVDQDINSISLPNCDGSDVLIDFIVPPNETVGICGWPAGMGFTGDECFQAPISGGSAGKSVTAQIGRGLTSSSSGKSIPRTANRGGNNGRRGGGGTGGGAGGGASCMCVPGSKGELVIKSCNANNSLNCSSTKSLKLIACGGQGPYSWSKTGSVVLSATTGSTTTVTPPANTGSGTAGTAYTAVKSYGYCGSSSPNCGPGCGPLAAVTWTEYGCNDNVISSGSADDVGDPTGCGASFDGACVDGPCTDCVNGNCRVGFGHCSGSVVFPSSASAAALLTPVTGGTVCDKRTAPMISAGCVPCGLNAGSTVSVTDAVGTVVTIVLRQ